MTINERVRAAVTPVIPDCVPGEYTGDSETYATFDVIETPDVLAEGTAHAVVATVVLHWYRSKNIKVEPVRTQLVQNLLSQGATYPTITHGAEEIILEFELEAEAIGTV